MATLVENYNKQIVLIYEETFSIKNLVVFIYILF